MLIPKVFNISTVAVKFVSCALCVASGLPVGPEGPMIHLGAAIGAALSQGHSTSLGFTTNVFKRECVWGGGVGQGGLAACGCSKLTTATPRLLLRLGPAGFRNPSDKRDAVTAGVAVGVATAFNAPIGGLLFAFEEVASFWKHSLGWQVCRYCVCVDIELPGVSGGFGW